MTFRTRRGLSRQEDWLLRRFLSRLQTGEIETSELVAVLIALRACGPRPGLLDWCDTIAHPKRDRGRIWQTGMALWHETVHVDEFFAANPIDIRRIPIAVFDAVVKRIEQLGIEASGLDLHRLYPGGWSVEEFLRELNFIYRRDHTGNYFGLDRRGATDRSDLKVVRAIVSLLDRRHYGTKPLHYDDVHSELVKMFARLIGSGSRVLTKQKNLLALHFLCAFHQTEVRPPKCRLRNPCFLTVDSTSSEHLALSFGVYEKQESGYDQRAIYREVRVARQLTASHKYARPYLVTDLKEREYLDTREKDERIWGTLFKSALRVRKTRGGHVLSRVHPLTLPRQRRDIHFPELL